MLNKDRVLKFSENMWTVFSRMLDIGDDLILDLVMSLDGNVVTYKLPNVFTVNKMFIDSINVNLSIAVNQIPSVIVLGSYPPNMLKHFYKIHGSVKDKESVNYTIAFEYILMNIVGIDDREKRKKFISRFNKTVNDLRKEFQDNKKPVNNTYQGSKYPAKKGIGYVSTDYDLFNQQIDNVAQRHNTPNSRHAGKGNNNITRNSIPIKTKNNKNLLGIWNPKTNKYENTPKIPTKNVTVTDFSYKPLDVRHTFLTLTSETYPQGYEEEVLKYLPELDMDEWGNYYKIIGESTTMFTCHLDTVGAKYNKVNVVTYMEGDDEILGTDGKTILGADDKAGLTCLLYMITNKVPGVYYFFLAEEVGGIGSGLVAKGFKKLHYLRNMKKCISFDRRGVSSIITQQGRVQCCSDEFGDALCAELNKNGHKMKLDPTGVFTDSKNFINLIPECTNISVGYQNEHTGREIQNISFLDRLCKALVKVDWEKLPIERTAAYNKFVSSEYADLFQEIEDNDFSLKMELKANKLYNSLDILMSDKDYQLEIEDGWSDLIKLNILFNKYNLKPNVYFDYDVLKIELL